MKNEVDANVLLTRGDQATSPAVRKGCSCSRVLLTHSLCSTLIWTTRTESRDPVLPRLDQYRTRDRPCRMCLLSIEDMSVPRLRSSRQRVVRDGSRCLPWSRLPWRGASSETVSYFSYESRCLLGVCSSSGEFGGSSDERQGNREHGSKERSVRMYYSEPQEHQHQEGC